MNREKYLHFGTISTTHSLKGALKLRIYPSLITSIDSASFMRPMEYHNHTSQNNAIKSQVKQNSDDNLNTIFSAWVYDQNLTKMKIVKEGMYKNLGFIIKIVGINDLGTAKEMVDKKLYIERQSLREEIVRSDVIGLPARCDTSGGEIGKVVGVVNFGASDIFIIEGEKDAKEGNTDKKRPYYNNNAEVKADFFERNNEFINKDTCKPYLIEDRFSEGKKVHQIYCPINKSWMKVNQDGEMMLMVQKEFFSY